MKSICSLFGFVLFAIAVLTPTVTRAQATPFELVSSSTNGNQDFGFTVDLEGNVAVVGAFRDDDGLTLERGAAFVFRFDGTGWNEEGVLMSSIQNPFNWFGWDVAISGDVIAVAERNGDELLTNAGNVVVFREGIRGPGWGVETLLNPPGGLAGEDFGFAVDVDGEVIAVGAPSTDGVLADEGTVYVFRFSEGKWRDNGWLKASDAGLQDLFGSAISIDGDRMLVSAFNAADSTSNQAGKVYVFDYNGTDWIETAILQSNASNGLANMGISVSLQGDWAASGAPGDNDGGFGSGAVVVHHYDGANWNFHSKLGGSDGAGFFLFGTSVSVSDTMLAVGAENWAAAGQDATGRAYLFAYNASNDMWVETDALVPAGAGTGDEFGQSIAIDGEVTLVGSPDFGGPGAAFVYGEPRNTTSIDDEIPPAAFRVSAVYPNPFNARSSLVVTPETNQTLRVGLYDVLGREVKTLFEGRLSASTPATIAISADDSPNGLYIVRVESEQGVISRSVMLMR